MSKQKPGPKPQGRIYMETMRPLALPEEREIINQHFESGEFVKSVVVVRWMIQGIAKDREVSPFLQTRLLLEGGGIADDELEQLKTLIEELLK
jgi:hypothetical protein